MPSVLMNVLSSTLTFRHTVSPIELVSFDNLHVISPTQKIIINYLLFNYYLLSCSVMFFVPALLCHVSSLVLLCLAWSVTSVQSCISVMFSLDPTCSVLHVRWEIICTEYLHVTFKEPYLSLLSRRIQFPAWSKPQTAWLWFCMWRHWWHKEGDPLCSLHSQS